VATSELVSFNGRSVGNALPHHVFRIPLPPFFASALSDRCIKPRDINNFFFPLTYDVRHVLQLTARLPPLVCGTFLILGPVYYPAPRPLIFSSRPAISSLFLSHTFHLGPLHLTFRRESPSSPPRSNSNIHTWFPPTKYTRHHGTPALPRSSEP